MIGAALAAARVGRLPDDGQCEADGVGCAPTYRSLRLGQTDQSAAAAVRQTGVSARAERKNGPVGSAATETVPGQLQLPGEGGAVPEVLHRPGAIRFNAEQTVFRRIIPDADVFRQRIRVDRRGSAVRRFGCFRAGHRLGDGLRRGGGIAVAGGKQKENEQEQARYDQALHRHSSFPIRCGAHSRLRVEGRRKPKTFDPFLIRRSVRP